MLAGCCQGPLPTNEAPPLRLLLCCVQEAPAAHLVEVWKKGVCSDTFHPRFRR